MVSSPLYLEFPLELSFFRRNKIKKVTTEYLSLSELLTLYRNRCRLTQRQLATHISYDPSLISRWERGLRLPTLVDLEVVKQALNLTVHEHQNLINARNGVVAETLTFHEILTLYLNQIELNDDQLAKHLQVSTRQLRRWRLGERLPTNQQLTDLTQTLQLTQEQISRLQSANPVLRLDKKVLEFILVGSGTVPYEQLAEFSPRGVVLMVQL